MLVIIIIIITLNLPINGQLKMSLTSMEVMMF